MKEKLIQKLEDCALILDKAQINETKFQLRLVEIRSDIAAIRTTVRGKVDIGARLTRGVLAGTV